MSWLLGYCQACSSACGVVHLDPSGVTLAIHGETGKVTGFFTCPRCGELVAGPVGEVVDQLLPYVTVQMFNAIPSNLDPRFGPPLTAADVLYFRNKLNEWTI